MRCRVWGFFPMWLCKKIRSLNNVLLSKKKMKNSRNIDLGLLIIPFLISFYIYQDLHSLKFFSFSSEFSIIWNRLELAFIHYAMLGLHPEKTWVGA